MQPLFVYITFPDAQSADAVARELVERRLAACTNRHGPIASTYRFEGEINEDQEFVLIAKTTAGQFEALKNCVLSRHPYALPCILALAVDPVHAHQPYLDWITAETAD